eukprot:816634-Pleurochrysis_carterae.AAC.1
MRASSLCVTTSENVAFRCRIRTEARVVAANVQGVFAGSEGREVVRTYRWALSAEGRVEVRVSRERRHGHSHRCAQIGDGDDEEAVVPSGNAAAYWHAFEHGCGALPPLAVDGRQD